MRYTPQQTNPATLAAAIRYVRDEFRRIANALRSNNAETLTLTALHVEPDKPDEGMLVYADGSDWNPGNGTGLYQYRSGAWTFIG